MKMDEHLRGGGGGGEGGGGGGGGGGRCSTFPRKEQFCGRTYLGGLFIDKLCEKGQ